MGWVRIVFQYPFLSFSEVLTRDIYISLTWPGTPPNEGSGLGCGEWGCEDGGGRGAGGPRSN